MLIHSVIVAGIFTFETCANRAAPATVANDSSVPTGLCSEAVAGWRSVTLGYRKLRVYESAALTAELRARQDDLMSRCEGVRVKAAAIVIPTEDVRIKAAAI